MASTTARSTQHGDAGITLLMHHREPFNRMLAAQAMAEKLVIVSAGRWMLEYEVAILSC